MVSNNFVSSYRGVRAFPSETYLSIKLKLRKGDDLILEKNYSINNKQSNSYNYGNNNQGASNSILIDNMAESLSLCTKQIIEEIIFDIDNSIKDN